MELTTEQKAKLESDLRIERMAVARLSTALSEITNDVLTASEIVELDIFTPPEAVDAIKNKFAGFKSRIAELEQQVAELSKDKARLDWLDSTREFEGRYQKNCNDLERVYFYLSDPWDEVFSGEGSDLREAIDAAIAKDKEHE